MSAGAREGDPTTRPLIQSLDNPRVKEVAALRSSRERRRRGVFVVEGERELARAEAAGLRLLEVFYVPGAFERRGGQPVSDRVLAKMSYRARPQGVLALVEAPRVALPDAGTLYLVAVGLEKPGNLGAMARSAEAAGADALLVAEGSFDPFNPNAIRASTGAVFTLPVVPVSLEQVRALPVVRVAAVVGAGAPPAEVDLRRPVAITVGAEDAGLPAHWRVGAEEVSIPIAPGGSTESLNASVAAAVLLFEAVRQRG